MRGIWRMSPWHSWQAMKGERRAEYQARAREAERRAEEAADAAARTLWREIAEGYWRMAQVDSSASERAA